MRQSLWAIAALMILAACGGGGGGSAAPPTVVSSTPTPGSNPTASPTPSHTPTASPVPTATPPPPAWDATHHLNYFAIVYTGNANMIAVFAPGYATPSATISYPTCCIYEIGFDAQGNLLAAHDQNGLLIYAPGGTSPVRVLGTQGGDSLAIDALGDYAIGGDTSVEVYPSGQTTGSYSLPGQVGLGGLGFSATGEIAVPQSTGTIQTFPRNSQTPNRTFPVNFIGGGGVNAGLVAYDGNGNLAIAQFGEHTISVYPPNGTSPMYTVSGIASLQWMKFDQTNRLLAGDNTAIYVYSAGTSTLTKTIPTIRTVEFGEDSLGNFDVSGYTSASEIVLANGSTLTLNNLPYAEGLAISP